VLQVLYILAFAVLAFLAIGNLVRNLFTLGTEAGRTADRMDHPARGAAPAQPPISLHPEMLDDRGQPIREPLLVMKSITVEDARSRLDALFDASPGDSSNPSSNSQPTDEA
jgi:hypothetical protein